MKQVFELNDTSILLIFYYHIFQNDIGRFCPDSPFLHVPTQRSRTCSISSGLSYAPSIRSFHSTQGSTSEEYHCSHPAEIFKFREKWKLILPVLSKSWFLRILFIIFLFYISVILFSVVLLIFSIWF